MEKNYLPVYGTEFTGKNTLAQVNGSAEKD
jgi:hypothetical protein